MDAHACGGMPVARQTPDTAAASAEAGMRGEEGGDVARPARLGREALARATLTFCLDGADALMYATIKGAGSACDALDLIIETHDGVAGAQQRLERMFCTGLVRWGRRPTPQGMGMFRRSLAGWMARLDLLPSPAWETLGGWFTMDGGQWIIAPGDPCWPERLQDLSTHKDWASPLCLWGIGDPHALTSCPQPLAVVGSRDATDYGRSVARDVAALAAAKGHLVVSGGALGTDAAAHWGALAAWNDARDACVGRTVAVFAGGLNHVGPAANGRLFEKIVDHGGALVSELCPGTIPAARRFLLRNRIIAALAAHVVVAQARTRSGALNTAGWACDLGRDVIAVPGDITMPHNAGCNRLIAEGKSIILTSCDEIPQLMHDGHEPRTPEDARAGDGGDETIVHAIRSCARRRSPATVGLLLSLCNQASGARSWTMPRLIARLGELEARGVITRQAGGVTLAAGGTVSQAARDTRGEREGRGALAPNAKAGTASWTEPAAS